MVESKEVKERRKLIEEKEKELKQMKKEEMHSWWRSYRIIIYYALERLFIAILSLVVFILHCTNTPEEGSRRNDSLIDRALTPMAFGGDAMLQLGLFIACVAYLYAHPALLLLVDVITGILILLHLCFAWQSSITGLALAVFLLSLFDLVFHTVMVVKAALKIRQHRKQRSTFGSEGRVSEPEGWSWVGSPRYSSSTWSRKGTTSIISTRTSAARSASQMTRGSDLAQAKPPPSKKSLLTQAQERWDRELKEQQEREREKEKSLKWEESKQETPKSSFRDMSIPKTPSRSTAAPVRSTSRMSDAQPSGMKSYSKAAPGGSRNVEEKPKPPKKG